MKSRYVRALVLAFLLLTTGSLLAGPANTGPDPLIPEKVKRRRLEVIAGLERTLAAIGAYESMNRNFPDPGLRGLLSTLKNRMEQPLTGTDFFGTKVTNFSLADQTVELDVIRILGVYAAIMSEIKNGNSYPARLKAKAENLGVLKDMTTQVLAIKFGITYRDGQRNHPEVKAWLVPDGSDRRLSRELVLPSGESPAVAREGLIGLNRQPSKDDKGKVIVPLTHADDIVDRLVYGSQPNLARR